MNTQQQIAYLIYFFLMPVLAPLLWLVTVRELVAFVRAKQWMLALVFAIVISYSMVVFYTDFVVPIIKDNLPYTIPSVWNWLALMLTIPTTFIAVYYPKREKRE